ncbi:MAG TPA: peptide deformylase [Chloroflexia bacterium]|nr:peptide deformylase [Chloroflexia bacterium]
MALLNVRSDPDPILREKAKRIKTFDASLRKLAADMFETMHANNGVGLAAPQIGLSIRLLVAELAPNKEENEPGFKVALINPEIVKVDKEMASGYEGCLSIPGWIGEVPRHVAVTVKAQTPEGKEVRIKAHDYFARVLQHEIDHLDGILFTDRIVDINTLQRLDPDTSEEEEKLLEV